MIQAYLTKIIIRMEYKGYVNHDHAHEIPHAFFEIFLRLL